MHRAGYATHLCRTPGFVGLTIHATALAEPAAYRLWQCVQGTDCQRLKGARHPSPNQRVEAASPAIFNSRIEERELIWAQTPAGCAAIVQDMLRRISLWDRDDSILAHTPVDDDLCRRLTRHSCQFTYHAGGVAI